MRNVVFCGALVGALISTGSTPQAQVRVQTERPNVMVLDGRGGQLGVMVEDTANGVRVGEVSRDSAAEKAGIKEGDIIVNFDGERVRSARHLTRLIQETAEGKSVKVTVTRDGKQQTLDATPEARGLSWNMSIDGDRIRRDIERGMREFGDLPRAFEFRRGPGGDNFFEYIAPNRGRLGVQVQTLTPQLQDYFGATEGGALVSSVTKDSAAEKAGIKAGDVITSINGDKVTNADELTSEIAGKSGEITIGLLRDKKSTTVKATIESRTERPRATTPRRGLVPAIAVRPA